MSMNEITPGEMANTAPPSPAFEVAVLLGRGMPLGEQRRTLDEIGVALVNEGLAERSEIAFAELSDPALSVVLLHLRDEGVRSVVVVPVIIPFDRNLKGWIGRWLSRWSAEEAGAMRVVLADPLDGIADQLSPVRAVIERARLGTDVREAIKPLKIKAGASRIPDVSRVALVCLGPRCAQAGAAVIYDQLRRRFGPHKPDDLQENEVLCLTTNCQGPCNFAPLVGIQPDNIWYGNLTPEALEGIADRHLAQGGEPVSPWAFQPGERLKKTDGALVEPDLPLAAAEAGAIRIRQAFVRKAMVEDNALAGFMEITNLGTFDDMLLAIECCFSARIAIHAAGGHDDILAGEGLPLPLAAGSTIRLQPGRLHLMLLDIPDVPDPGSTVDLVLTFRHAGSMPMTCHVHAPS
ncbi:MAG: hypothetical protein FD175_2694 [Beijerinckiaceae bacterium]|nr:MAG: hypothetical protein FD175_2694 [Beijerinckiaceae bacterium]